jgi:outer membrane protein W
MPYSLLTATQRTEPRQLVPLLLAVAFLLVLVPLSASAQFPKDKQPTAHDAFIERHQAGVRIGGWSNLGGTPADSVGVAQAAYYLTDFNEANFYLEGYFGFRFNRFLVGEFSVGIVSRGDVTLRDEFIGESRIGTLLVYPILAKFKLYPVGMVANRFHPYVMAGGGLYYGRHDVQIVSTQSAFFTAFDEDSETTFNYVVGGGFDWPLASVVGLDLNVQYMPIEFSNDLIDVRDYSSFTVTVGVKYLFSPQREKR